jgi:hypothetical protein
VGTGVAANYDTEWLCGPCVCFGHGAPQENCTHNSTLFIIGCGVLSTRAVGPRVRPGGGVLGGQGGARGAGQRAPPDQPPHGQVGGAAAPPGLHFHLWQRDSPGYACACLRLVLSEACAGWPNLASGGGRGPSVAVLSHVPAGPVPLRLNRPRLRLGRRCTCLPTCCVASVDTSEGVVLIDCGAALAAGDVVDAVRALSPRPIHTCIYTYVPAAHACQSCCQFC